MNTDESKGSAPVPTVTDEVPGSGPFDVAGASDVSPVAPATESPSSPSSDADASARHTSVDTASTTPSDEVPVADVDPFGAASAPDTSTSQTAGAASALQTPVNSADSSSPSIASAAYVDPTGADPTKNDEVPSAHDGSTKKDVTYGDGICPLIADGPGTKKTLEVGGHDVTVQQPYRVLSEPVECPSCQKMVESSQLSWDMSAGGATRDCTTAMSIRAHPVSKEVQTALDSGEYAKAERINDRHPLRDKFLRLLEFRKKWTR